MSLAVSEELLHQAEAGKVSQRDFIACIQQSLPYAWERIELLATLRQVYGDPWRGSQQPPPDEQSRGQLLRAMASDAIRGALERHFKVKLAFQNCHRVAVFAPDHVNSKDYREFISPRSQLLNQSPELRDC